jgi:cytochrome P450
MESNITLRRIDNVGGPFALPLLGNALQMRRGKIHQVVEAWCKRHGALFRIRLGRTPVLVVARHETVAAIMRDRPEGFRRPTIFSQVSDEMGGLPGVFLAEGADWRAQRKMVMAAFAPHAVRAYFPSIVAVALRLRNRWTEAARDGRAIDLSADLKRYTVDIIAGLAFGKDVDTLAGGEDTIQQHLDIIMEAESRRSLSLLPYWRWFKLPIDRQLDRSVATTRRLIEELMAAARARLEADPARAGSPANMLEAMLVAASQEGSGVDDAAVAGNVSTMLLAGEDTTAHTIAWTIFLLQRHPGLMRQARAEVLALAPDPAALTLEQADALPFLDACVNEAMRLKPVGPFMPLEAVRPTVVEDVEVPAGGLLWCVMRHDSVDGRYFKNPLDFQPERWLQGETAAKRIGMPFGAGPRMCPGRYLALLEVKVALAMLLASFDDIAVDGSDEEHMAFVMGPRGLSMRLQRAAQ